MRFQYNFTLHLILRYKFIVWLLNSFRSYLCCRHLDIGLRNFLERDIYCNYRNVIFIFQETPLIYRRFLRSIKKYTFCQLNYRESEMFWEHCMGLIFWKVFFDKKVLNKRVQSDILYIYIKKKKWFCAEWSKILTGFR